MNKIIFCDKNKEIVNEVKKLFKKTVNNTNCELIVSSSNDVLKTKEKYPKAKIITASNQDFSMEGGLDALLKKTYPKQCENPREFKSEKDLFFTVTVDKNIKANKYWMTRSMFGAYMCSRKHDIIITGLGTGVGGLSVNEFISYLNQMIMSNFSEADFRGADFRWANFSGADFREANFRWANFSEADFRGANFRGANFSEANFRWANFSEADFRWANFSGADFRGANFRGANFNYRITPQKGKFIGWKKAKEKILKLEIQDASQVSGGLVSRKLRTNKVKVLEIQELNGNKSKNKKVSSDHDENFIYTLGKIIEVKNFVKDDKIECAEGIHFFITREEAVNY